MSNPISYDPLLCLYLARELNGRLEGRGCRGLPYFGEELTVTLPIDQDEALRCDLHPTRGWIRLLPERDETAEESELVCLGVSCPPDERRLEIRLRESGRFRVQEWQLVLELHTNQWNALLVDEATQRIVTVLRSRDAGGRGLRAGATYSPPPARPRYDGGSHSLEEAWERWREVLGSTPPEERTRALIREFAYTGALNARAVLGEALHGSDEKALRAAFARWWEIRSLPPAAPVLLRLPTGPHPYPIPLPEVPAERIASLLEGMERAAAAGASGAVGAVTDRERAMLLEAARRRQQAAARRTTRLRERLATAGEAERMRGYGDLLLAHLQRVPRGADSVELAGWEGEEVRIPLDPALSPAENATRWYHQARRHTRALEKLPGLLVEAEVEARRWEEALQEAQARGELAGWAVAELERQPAQQGGAGAREEGSLPYRRYRTSGGLEVRVGRSSKDNDRLTFGFSSPGDVWLHARSVPGSHVILRWPQPEANPPARDLAQAAGLAALFSKARTSGLVAVDWTRRKYVRKPRGAPPGTVIPQRVKTLFVEPDPGLEEQLREQGG